MLVNSDFSALRDVISEGRRVINNITKSAGVFFIKTIYSVLLCIMCLILNKDFPFIPIQITHMTVGSAIVLPIMLAAGFAAERGVALWKPLRS